ncbi:MAG: hypothetical protein F6K09_07245 [Merismopedia sp. SIO2A8]|nr:hypothetical protein [Merismopedia sp. SIO2A8]
MFVTHVAVGFRFIGEMKRCVSALHTYTIVLVANTLCTFMIIVIALADDVVVYPKNLYPGMWS